MLLEKVQFPGKLFFLDETILELSSKEKSLASVKIHASTTDMSRNQCFRHEKMLWDRIRSNGDRLLVTFENKVDSDRYFTILKYNVLDIFICPKLLNKLVPPSLYLIELFTWDNGLTFLENWTPQSI